MHGVNFDAASRSGARIARLSAEQQASLDAALRLVAQRGWAVFPCCLDKRPATAHGYLDAVSDPEDVQRLWHASPGSLVGLPTGAINNVSVLDIDAKHATARTWWATNRPLLPVTSACRTRSGGLHVFFRHRPGLRCSAGRIAQGVDVRADGGYVIHWPSTGMPILSDAALAPWPDWLTPAEVPPAKVPHSRAVIPDTKKLAGLMRLVALATEGHRNDTLFWAACRCGEMVSSGLLSQDAAIAMLAHAAFTCGLDAASAVRTAVSGLNSGRLTR